MHSKSKSVLVILGAGIFLASCSESGSGSREGCEDWDRYISEVNNYSPTLNSRLNLLNNADQLTDSQIQTAIDAFENDIESWKAADPPANAKALNDQLIVVLEGWIGIFDALKGGTYEQQMLFDLQEEDDELELVTREANEACAD